jgi:hypothetical protein
MRGAEAKRGTITRPVRDRTDLEYGTTGGTGGRHNEREKKLKQKKKMREGVERKGRDEGVSLCLDALQAKDSPSCPPPFI